MSRGIIAAAAAFIMATTIFVGWQVHAEANKTTFPENIDELVHYATVRRGEVTEHLLTSQAAIDAIKSGQSVPLGTHVVLVDYRGGEVFRYFVMEKGENWGADFPESRRTGDWQFQWFKPDRTINLAENTARCQSCHSSRADEEFMFSHGSVQSFNGTAIE
ncbi:cytochrome P460 family protein [Rhizobium sp. 2MFCol3.1]|uniref:cytochrome P460 family protein n=1 Tax=Rhizobium sp. 2MFCol3.1 TaxID=1246459 RepID=UPI00037B789E|nr:cytochrome P460 family protein [Rhizobium sp. 2MFCol3.1]